MPSCLQQYYRIQLTMTYLNLFSLFSSGMENLDELLSAVMQRIGAANDHDRPHILVKTQLFLVLYDFILL